jgi:hypothetical protein
MIDYYLSKAPEGEVQLEILDGAGKSIRKFSSTATTTGERGNRAAAADAEAAPADDEEGGGFRLRGAPVRVEKSPGMHRFTWDLRYPGPWQSAERTEGPNGPMAVPGKYAVKLTVGTWTSTEPLLIVEDPRIVKSGVTTADLKEQFDHNMRVRELVSEVNKAVAHVRAAQAKVKSGSAKADDAKVANLNDVAAQLITPSIRYSQPELQTHIAYLYSMTNMADQKIGRDAMERLKVLQKRMAEIDAQLNQLLPAFQ